MGRRDEAGRVSRGWAGPGAGADWAGQDACGLWREVGEEGVTERVKRLAPRRFCCAWVLPATVAAMRVPLMIFRSAFVR